MQNGLLKVTSTFKLMVLRFSFVDVLGDDQYQICGIHWWHTARFGMLSANCSILVICLYLLTFVVVLPAICFVLPLHHSVYYQLFNKLVVLVKLDATFQMDIDLLSKLFVTNIERVDVANRFLEHQQSNLVIQKVSTLPVKFEVKTHIEDDANLAQEVEHVTVDTSAAVAVSVVIISAGRDSVVSNGQKYAPQYLTQNVARFMALIGEQKQFDQVLYHLLVCSVGEHITAEEQSIGHLVQLVRDPQLDSGFTFGPFHDRLAWRSVVCPYRVIPNQFMFVQTKCVTYYGACLSTQLK